MGNRSSQTWKLSLQHPVSCESSSSNRLFSSDMFFNQNCHKITDLNETWDSWDMVCWLFCIKFHAKSKNQIYRRILKGPFRKMTAVDDCPTTGRLGDAENSSASSLHRTHPHRINRGNEVKFKVIGRKETENRSSWKIFRISGDKKLHSSRNTFYKAIRL